jgi:hypothetical protein
VPRNPWFELDAKQNTAIMNERKKSNVTNDLEKSDENNNPKFTDLSNKQVLKTV